MAALEQEPDFRSVKPELQEVLEARGCKVLFGVKFHPELMMIESCYRYGTLVIVDRPRLRLKFDH